MAARWERKGRPPVHQGPQGKAAYPRFNGKSMNEGTLTVLNTAMDHRPSDFRRNTCPGITPALLPISAPRNMPKSASRSTPEAILAQRFMASTITHFSVLIQNDKKKLKNVKQHDQKSIKGKSVIIFILFCFWARFWGRFWARFSVAFLAIVGDPAILTMPWGVTLCCDF